MEEFVVGNGGILTEQASHDLAEWLVGRAPASDAGVQEAHIALLRAHTAVTSRHKEDGLARGHFRVLLQLSRAEGTRLPLSRLSLALNISPGNMTKLINAVEEEGWVERIADPHDRRITWAALTTAGAARFGRALPTVLSQIAEVWGDVSPEEVRLLTHLLNKLWFSALTLEARKALRRTGEGLSAKTAHRVDVG